MNKCKTKKRSQKSEVRSQIFICFANCLLAFLLCLLFSVFCPLSSICLAQETEEPPLSYYGIIEQRNLFRPKKELVVDKEKKDSEDEKTIYKDKPIEATDLVLTGVVKIRGNYKAILEKRTGDKSFYIKVNDTVQDYTVKDIQDDRIILQKDNREFMLSIEKRNGSDTTKNQDKSKGEIEQDKETSQSDQFKYEENIMQKMRMGIRR